MSAYAAESTIARELLAVDSCSVLLVNSLRDVNTSVNVTNSPPPELIAEGHLRILALSPILDGPDPLPERVVLSIIDPALGTSSDLHDTGCFCYPVLPETPVWLHERGMCLTFPEVSGEGVYGMFLDRSRLDQVAAQLEACGCTVRRGGSGASLGHAADAVQKTGEAMAEAITVASGVLSWGVHRATASAKRSSLLTPADPVPIPAVVREEVGHMRHATNQVVTLSGALIDGIARAGRQVADRIGADGGALPGGTIGAAALGAGAEVFVALGQAADQLVKDVAGSSSELVGHKFGEEAGAVSRDAMHVVGNLRGATSYATTRGVAKKVVHHTAGSISQTTLASHDAATAPIAGLVLGPQPAANNMQPPALTVGPSAEVEGVDPKETSSMSPAAPLDQVVAVATSVSSDHKFPSESQLEIKTSRFLYFFLVFALVVCAVVLFLCPLICVIGVLLLICVALFAALMMISRRARTLEAQLTRPLAEPLLPPDWMADMGAASGSQYFVDGAWAWAREWASTAGSEILSLIRWVELGESPPKVIAVRKGPSVEENVVCYDVDVAFVPSSQRPYADLAITVPGRSEPLAVRVYLTHFEGTVQVYFWSSPPEGRGNGKPYSLIEAALAPRSPRPPLITVELAAVARSTLLDGLLPLLQQVAADVIVTHVLPRVTGFEKRLVFQEASLQGKEHASDQAWEQKARRAGWVPRTEAEIESALAEMMRRAGDRAVAGAGNAAANLAATAQRLASGAAERAANSAAPSQAARVATGAAGSALGAAGAAVGAAAMLANSFSRRNRGVATTSSAKASQPNP